MTNPPRSGEGGTGSNRRLLGSQIGVGDPAQGHERLALELAHPLGGDAVALADVGQLLLTTVEQCTKRLTSPFAAAMSITSVPRRLTISKSRLSAHQRCGMAAR